METQEKFAELVYKAGEDPAIKCILVYGSAKFFSSGNDISIFHDTKNIMANAKRGTLEATYHFIGSVMNNKKPVIFFVRGKCIGMTFTCSS